MKNKFYYESPNIELFSVMIDGHLLCTSDMEPGANTKDFVDEGTVYM